MTSNTETPELLPCPFDREELIDLIQIGIDNTMDIDTSSYDWAGGAADSLLKAWQTRSTAPKAALNDLVLMDKDDIVELGDVTVKGLPFSLPEPTDGAPETVYIHHSDQITVDGTMCLVFTSSAPPAFGKSETAFVHKDLSDARIAARDARIEELEGPDVVAHMNYQSRIASLTEQLATARNEALEEAAKDAKKYHGGNTIAKSIRALKSEGEG